MKKDVLDYPSMVDEAMRGVVRQSLKTANEYGLSDNHHFYISFNTLYSGVSISPQLRARYPEEITIVIQHQFWDLEVYKHFFSVVLSFNNVPEKLVVPFDALTAFADPSVRFGLQFHSKPSTPIGANNDSVVEDSHVVASPFKNEKSTSTNLKNDGDKNKVISLDAFRKS